jgi:hypothetical protein
VLPRRRPARADRARVRTKEPGLGLDRPARVAAPRHPPLGAAVDTGRQGRPASDGVNLGWRCVHGTYGLGRLPVRAAPQAPGRKAGDEVRRLVGRELRPISADEGRAGPGPVGDLACR